MARGAGSPGGGAQSHAAEDEETGVLHSPAQNFPIGGVAFVLLDHYDHRTQLQRRNLLQLHTCACLDT